MKLPDRDFYTIEELLEERWKSIWPDMTVDFIRNLIAEKKIEASPSEWDEGRKVYTKSIFLDEIKRYEAEHKISAAPSEVDNPKGIGSLLKLVATMAIKGYRYNPAELKSSIPSAI